MTLEQAQLKRWKARTDLLWLCNNLLDMHKVSAELNGTMISRLYQFPKPKSVEEMQKHDFWDRESGQWIYTPLIYDTLALPGRLPDPARMPGKKRALILDSRGFFKTTCNVVAHTIQWILNYPDVTVLIVQGNMQLAGQFVGQIKSAFWRKPKIRELFPELCVPLTQKEFGNMEEFTIPGRSYGYTREQPTVRAISILKAGAGQHVEVIKYSDIVNEDNYESKDMCAKISDRFKLSSRNLLSGSDYWVDVEGTRYSGFDCYGEIIDEEMQQQMVSKVWYIGRTPYLKRSDAEVVAMERGLSLRDIKEKTDVYIPQPEKREYNVYINICYKLKDSETRKYDYDDMLVDLEPFWLRDELGRPVSRSKDWTVEKLEMERQQNPELFNCQKLNNPIVRGSEAPFPVNEQYPRLIKRSDFKSNVRIAYYEVGIDTALTIGKRSDYSAIVVAAFDAGGRCYVTEIIHGKFQEETTSEHIMDVFRRYRPRRIVMERDNGNSGIRVWLRRLAQLAGDDLPIVDMPKLPGIAKSEKIKRTLRSWYVSGHLVFLDDLGLPLEYLKMEMQKFESRWHDDILDALSAVFFDKPWVGRNMDRVEHFGERITDRNTRLASDAFKKHIGIYDYMANEEEYPDAEPVMSPYYRITGGL